MTRNAWIVAAACAVFAARCAFPEDDHGASPAGKADGAAQAGEAADPGGSAKETAPPAKEEGKTAEPAAPKAGEKPAPNGGAKAPAPKPPAIAGRVLFPKDNKPEVEAIEVTEEKCKAAHEAHPLLKGWCQVNEDGTLPNALVYVAKGLGDRKFEPPKEARVLDQKDCVYTPHVVGVQVGQALKIANSDAVTHNIHAEAEVCTAWQNQSMTAGASAIEWAPDLEEFDPPFRTKCDLHPWMNAYVAVFSHPYYAVTGSDGRFTIEALPAGMYTLAVWHEGWAKKKVEVEVKDGEVKEVDVTLDPREE